MSKNIQAVIIKKEMLTKEICKMTASSEYICKNALPGQFLNIICSQDALLRRPISICDVSLEKNEFDIVFMLKGKGTNQLSLKKEGDLLDVIGPSGTSFDISSKYKKIMTVGGGIGVYPLLYLLKYSNAATKTCCLGFRSSDFAVLTNEFVNCTSTFHISTDDGSAGSKELVTERMKKAVETDYPDIIYTCGPTQMIKAVAQFAHEYKIPCQVSMEQRMGCGIGACLVCACKTKKDNDDGWDYSHVCKDGPVFWSDRVIFD